MTRPHVPRCAHDAVRARRECPPHAPWWPTSDATPDSPKGSSPHTPRPISVSIPLAPANCHLGSPVRPLPASKHHPARCTLCKAWQRPSGRDPASLVRSMLASHARRVSALARAGAMLHALELPRHHSGLVPAPAPAPAPALGRVTLVPIANQIGSATWVPSNWKRGRPRPLNPLSPFPPLMIC